MLSWFCPCIIFNYYQTSFLDHISLIPSRIIETEMNFDINILIHYGSSLFKHPCKNLVSIFEMKLMSGELSIMSFNVNFIRFHMKNVSLFAASLDFISFEALVYFFLEGTSIGFRFYPVFQKSQRHIWCLIIRTISAHNVFGYSFILWI